MSPGDVGLFVDWFCSPFLEQPRLHAWSLLDWSHRFHLLQYKAA